MSHRFLGVTPILPAESVEDTARFYEEKLGFTIDVEWANPPYGVARRGDTVIEFGEGRKDFAGSGVCHIHVGDADSLYREWRGMDIEFVGDLADRDYGCRDFRIRDNNGNMLIVGHGLESQEQLLREGNLRAVV